jgi:hypothetical protein
MPPPNAAAGALTRAATRRPFAAPATAAAEAGEDRGSLGGTENDEAMASRARRAAHLLGSPRARAGFMGPPLPASARWRATSGDGWRREEGVALGPTAWGWPLRGAGSWHARSGGEW